MVNIVNLCVHDIEFCAVKSDLVNSLVLSILSFVVKKKNNKYFAYTNKSNGTG